MHAAATGGTLLLVARLGFDVRVGRRAGGGRGDRVLHDGAVDRELVRLLGLLGDCLQELVLHA